MLHNLFLRGSSVFEKGCWIGLRDPTGTGDFDWVAPLYVGGLPAGVFTDWHRGEPNNHTVSEGLPTNGELCAALTPWQDDPLVQEQGSWADEACSLNKPFICQIFAQTQRYIITTTQSANLTGGSMEGGHLLLGNGHSHIDNFSVSKSATLTLSAASSGSTIGRLLLEDGAALVVNSLTTLDVNAFVGETAWIANAQPYITVLAGKTLSAGTGANITVNARLHLLGTLRIGAGSTVSLKQVFYFIKVFCCANGLVRVARCPKATCS